MRSLVLLFAFWFGLAPAFANNAFVAPTANGIAAVGQLPGTTTNDAAAAGKVGEILEFTAPLQSVSLVTNTAKTVISGSLTAGDWEVTCTVYFLPAGTTTTQNFTVELSPTDNTAPNTLGKFVNTNYVNGTVLTVNNYSSVSTPPIRIALSANTTYYCVANTNFGVSTMTAGAVLHARRAR